MSPKTVLARFRLPLLTGLFAVSVATSLAGPVGPASANEYQDCQLNDDGIHYLYDGRCRRVLGPQPYQP